MVFVVIVFLAIGVSMDAFAVSITNGLCYNNGTPSTAKVALGSAATFGFFQGLMPLLGFLAGSLFYEVAEAFDHWIALVLLVLIGGKMIYDGVKEYRTPAQCPCAPFTFKTLLLQGIATSIDAFAVGISLAMDTMNIAIVIPAIVVTTFVFSFAGVYIGKYVGKKLQDKAQIVGGLILVAIGINIFVQHMFFGGL